MDSITQTSCLSLGVERRSATQEKPYINCNRASALPPPPGSVRVSNGC